MRRGWALGLILAGGSIREFCRLDMPVIMFDKDENFVVLMLEEVRRLL